MSENDKDKDKDKTGITATVVVQGKEEIEELNKKLKKALEEKGIAEDTLKDLTKKADELTNKQQITEEEKEDLKAKLETIATKAFEKAKTDFIAQAKGLVPDDQIKEMESSITSPEKLEQSRFMLQYMQNLKKQYDDAQAAAKKADDEKKAAEQKSKELKGSPSGAAGKTPLSGEEQGQTGGEVRQYDTYQAMIDDLRVREKSKDPKVAEEAHKILNEFFGKWVVEIKRDSSKSGFKAIEVEKSFNQLVKEGLKEEQGKTESEK